MTSGTRRPTRNSPPRPILSLALLLTCATTSAVAANPGVEGLEKRLARTPPVSTSFVEFRFSRLLKRPLRTSGQLEYRADGVMARTVDTPYREHTEIAGDELRIRRGDKPERRVSLARAPQMRLLLGSFRALLEGRLAPLAADFETTFDDRGERWSLTLKPRDAKLARGLDRIEVFGAADRPICIESIEPDGDATLTVLGAGPAPGVTPQRAALERSCRDAATPATP